MQTTCVITSRILHSLSRPTQIPMKIKSILLLYHSSTNFYVLPVPCYDHASAEPQSSFPSSTNRPVWLITAHHTHVYNCSMLLCIRSSLIRELLQLFAAPHLRVFRLFGRTEPHKFRAPHSEKHFSGSRYLPLSLSIVTPIERHH